MQAFAPFGLNDIQAIVAFLPRFTQEICCYNNASLLQLVSPVPNFDCFDDCTTMDLDKLSIELKQGLPSDFVVKETIWNRFVNRLACALEYPSHYDASSRVLRHTDIASLWSNKSSPNTERAFADHRRIERLHIIGGDGETCPTLFTLWLLCMPRLKSVVIAPSLIRLDMPRITNSVIVNSLDPAHPRCLQLGTLETQTTGPPFHSLTKSAEVFMIQTRHALIPATVTLLSCIDYSKLFYVPRIACHTLAHYLQPTLMIDEEERINLASELVGNMIRFFLNGTTWIDLLTHLPNRPIYNLIRRKIQSGQTLHTCTFKAGISLFDTGVIDTLLNSHQGVEVFLKLVKDQIAFPDKNQVGQPIPSFLRLYRLMQQGFHVMYSFQFAVQVKEMSLTMAAHPMVLKLKKLSEAFTLSQIENLSMLDVLTKQTDDQVTEYFCGIFSCSLTSKYHNQIAASIRSHWRTWATILAVVIKREEGLFIVRCLHHIEPEGIKTSLVDALKNVPLKTCSPMRYWLIKQGIWKICLTEYEQIMME